MTKEEVERRKLMVNDDSAKLKEFQKVAGSERLIRAKLVEELEDVKTKLNDWLKNIEKQKKEVRKKLTKARGRKK